MLINLIMKWESKLIKHKGESRIAVTFEKKPDFIARFKEIEGSKWSETLKLWHVPDTDDNRIRFNLVVYRYTLPSAEGIEQITKFKQWLSSKRYSERTIKTYSDALKSFLVFYNEKAVAEITNEDVIVYNNEFILKNKLSASYQNQIVNAIKLFFKTIQNKQIDPEVIHRPKRDKLLPNVLSKEEVKLILNSQKNLKHKTMLSLIYSCGLRRSELLNLKLNDIDSKRNIITVRQSKGKKDRIVPLSPKILLMLRDYYIDYKPKTWLFEGLIAGEKYSEQSLQCAFKQALAKTNIKKPVSLHWLRHSPACRQAGMPHIY